MSFDLQPLLAGELIGLRPLRIEDFNDLYSVASDPLIWEQRPSVGPLQGRIPGQVSLGRGAQPRNETGYPTARSQIREHGCLSGGSAEFPLRALEKIGGVRAGSRLDAAGRDSYVFQTTAAPYPPAT